MSWLTFYEMNTGKRFQIPLCTLLSVLLLYCMSFLIISDREIKSPDLIDFEETTRFEIPPPCEKDNTTKIRKKLRHIPFIEPFQYIDKYKNPCWREAPLQKLQCIPYFHIAGFSKCGTTDLFRRLQKHPDIYPTQVKETHFFDTGIYSHVNISRYVQYFENASQAIEREVNFNHQTIIGESTPMYAYSNLHWQIEEENAFCSEPRILTAHHLHHLNPAAKTILVLRNPTKRLYSDYLFRVGTKRKRKVSNAHFHQMVEKSIRLYSDCFDRYSLRQCLYNNTLFKSCDRFRLKIGIYFIYLKDWYSVFGNNQVLILSFEEYEKNMRAVLTKIFNYLGLKPPDEDVWTAILSMEKLNANGLYKEAGAMLPRTKEMLDTFYSPFNKLLYGFLQDLRFYYV